MPSVLVRELLYQVSEALGDVSPQFVTWTERELVDWLNAGQRALAKYLPHVGARVDAVKLAPGTRQSLAKILAANIKPGDGATPADTYGIRLNDVIRNMGADGMTAGAVLRVVQRETLDAHNRNWHVTAGSGVVEEYSADPRTPLVFYVRPGAPATPAVWVEISYDANPKPIPNAGTPGSELYAASGSSTATISVGDEFEDDLVNYILARAYVKDPAKAQGAANASAAFLASLNAQVAAVTGRNPNLKMLPLTPGVSAAEQ